MGDSTRKPRLDPWCCGRGLEIVHTSHFEMMVVQQMGFSSTGLSHRSTNAMIQRVQTSDQNQCAGGGHAKNIQEESVAAEYHNMPAGHCDHRGAVVKFETTFYTSSSRKTRPANTSAGTGSEPATGGVHVRGLKSKKTILPQWSNLKIPRTCIDGTWIAYWRLRKRL